MMFTLFAVFLFSLGGMSAVEVDDGRPTSCCVGVSNTKIPVKDIVNYSMQTTLLCPIKAVRFQTKRNKIICSDPNDGWAKRVIHHLNEKKNPLKPSEEPISATNLISTTTSTNKTGTEAETSTSTLVTPVVTTIKTSGYSNLH
ncbi:eotaxin-like [Carassius gibelio]|uniref:eotaxin-like n=1 Tax=Carassius gibelio TaxID=101364 RepID=UPI002278C065|nr:eotaxin-like [Carassius gibelio]